MSAVPKATALNETWLAVVDMELTLTSGASAACCRHGRRQAETVCGGTTLQAVQARVAERSGTRRSASGIHLHLPERKRGGGVAQRWRGRAYRSPLGGFGEDKRGEAALMRDAGLPRRRLGESGMRDARPACFQPFVFTMDSKRTGISGPESRHLFIHERLESLGDLGLEFGVTAGNAKIAEIETNGRAFAWMILPAHRLRRTTCQQGLPLSD